MSPRPKDRAGTRLPALAVTSFLFGMYGFNEILPPSYTFREAILDAAYRSLQLFFMNFEDPRVEGGPIDPVLQVARFGAFITTVWVILNAFFPQVLQTFRRWLRYRVSNGFQI